jgi:hypothetical protein
MNPTTGIASWALAPERTNDELFTLELLIETTERIWKARNHICDPWDWDALRAHVAERLGNPLYRPKFTPEQSEHAEEMAEQIGNLSGGSHEDRCMRNLEALRFFPKLNDVTVNHAEVEDLSPLTRLPGLTRLSLEEPALRHSKGLGSLEALASLPAVKYLRLSIRRPWPDLSPLARMPSLEEVWLHLNPLALAGIPALPLVRVAKLHGDFHWKTPVRSVNELPAMPKLEILELEGADDLAGIGRHPLLRNLDVRGTFRSLEPLAALSHVTFVRLEGEGFRDLRPLLRMAALREVLFVREEPLSLDALAEAPELREVRFERCDIMRMEVAALNAALSLWSEDFLVPRREAPPLRCLCYHPQHEEMKEVFRLRAEAAKGEESELSRDPALCAAHARWFEEQVNSRLDELLGPEWGASILGGHLTFRRYCDVARMREIVGALRELLLVCRYPPVFMLRFEPHGDMSETMDEIARRQRKRGERAWLDHEFDVEEEREQHEEFVQRRRADYERRAREHRLRLIEEQGLAADPQEFSTQAEPPREKVTAGPAPAEPPPAEEEDADLPDDDEEDEDDAGGGLATPPPSKGETSEFVQDLSFIVSLTSEALWITFHMRENAEYHWGEPAEDWHALPGPPAARPFPR